MYCKKCGLKNKEEANYCIGCGEALKNNTTSIFISNKTKKTSPFLIIGGTILFVFILFILREGASLFVKEAQIDKALVTYENFEFSFPTSYKTTIKNEVLYVSIPDATEDKIIGIQIYDSTLNEMIKKFQLLESYSGGFKNIQATNYFNQEFVTAEYEQKDIKSIVAITKAVGGKVFWIQSVTNSYEAGYEAIEELAEIVINATYVGDQENSNSSKINEI